MFGQCALRTTLSKLTSELRWLFTFSQPFLGPFFLFLPNLSRPPYPSCVNGLVFSHPGLPLPLDSSTTASHGSNRAGLECCQCPFCYLALKIANRAAHGLFPFLLILSLECLSTSQEENGCYGAEALDVSKLQGERLISLDGCEGTNTYVSSFRSDLVKCEKTLRWESASGAAVQVEVRDVSTNVYQGVPHQEQGNAVKLLARLLRAVSEAGATLRLFALEGGVAENIVPETAAVRFCYEGCSPEKLRALLQETFSQLTQELENPAQAGTLRITEVPAPDRAVTAQDSTSLAGLLYLLPNNLFQATAGEMTSICNLGVVKLDGESAWVLLSTRSRYASAGEELLRRCHTLADLTGFSFSTARRYEGWPYREDSPLRALAILIRFATPLTSSKMGVKKARIISEHEKSTDYF